MLGAGDEYGVGQGLVGGTDGDGEEMEEEGMVDDALAGHMGSPHNHHNHHLHGDMGEPHPGLHGVGGRGDLIDHAPLLAAPPHGHGVRSSNHRGSAVAGTLGGLQATGQEDEEEVGLGSTPRRAVSDAELRFPPGLLDEEVVRAVGGPGVDRG